MNGLIRVTYDPQKHPEPQAELTDSAKNEYCKKPPETDEETTGKPTHETIDGEWEAGEDAEWSNSDTA
ncbi:MAG: hypothetical protein NWE94_04635 [Candidatus Bathyarchaeota archaeon]|nr:hypothetical protein [Candidatus Bathyarchaeota archaeon]